MPPFSAYDAAGFAALSQELLREPAVENTLQKVVDLAVETLDGCDYAGVTLRHGRKLETPATSDPLVKQLDQLQYDLGGGPCLDAVFVDDRYVIENMTTEDRWPNWAPRAAALGVLSTLSVRLATTEDVVGALNLYSKTLQAYDDDQILTASIYATHASNAIAANSESQGLATGMRARHMIGMAQGMLMQRHHLTEQQAFQFLSRISQSNNVKLTDVVARILSQAQDNDGQLP